MKIQRRSMLAGLGALGASPTLATAAAGDAAATIAPTSVLPRGVSLTAMRRAIEEFRQIVGQDNLSVTSEKIAPYAKMYIPAPDAQHLPVGALAPDSVAQVQKILAVCNKYKVPVWPTSTGRNFGYGSSAPATRGQMVLDLRRMNRILDVDVELGTTLLEPGVTYQQLLDHFTDNKLPLWIDCPTIGPLVGPVGNTLDRGVGYTPYGEHFMFSCGMEVVMADGKVLRTGMGSVAKSNTWQAFKWGYGPYLDGIFTQSNYGVVTKLGLWLMHKPPVYKPFMIRYQNEADIDKIIDTLRGLRLSNIIPNVVLMMHGLYEVGMFKRRHEIHAGPGPIPEEAMRRAFKEMGVGVWNAYFALYGSPEQVAVNEQIVRAVVAPSGGEILTKEEAKDNVVFHHHELLMSGQLTLEELGLFRWRGAGGGAAWFAPVAKAIGSEAGKQVKMARKVLDGFGFDYTAGFAIGWRDLHHIVCVLHDRSVPDEKLRAQQCFDRLIDDFAAEGYGTYRTNIANMDKVANTFGPVKREIDHKLKRALDPNNIIAPGKSGIDLFNRFGASHA
ncbi:MAG TPA: FAD-binding oxidoreductase [Ideonella sp.]|nr:FAD-binding oxidoreductase [Ideonella sp.]